MIKSVYIYIHIHTPHLSKGIVGLAWALQRDLFQETRVAGAAPAEVLHSGRSTGRLAL